MRRTAILLTILSTGAASGCSPAVPATGPAPVAGVPVQIWRSRLDRQQASLVHVRNDSAQPILITSFQIYSCINVRQECMTYTPNIQVGPHQSVIVMQIDAINPAGQPIFGYNYKWMHVAAPARDTP